MIKQKLQESFNRYLEELKELIRIPSISFPGFDKAEVSRSAHAVENLLKKIGATNLQHLIPPSSYPCVYGEIISDKTKPTILLYAHHDVQPQMRETLWHSPPFEPEIRGERLYGRGSADDKAGILIHVAAVELILSTMKKNSPNFKFLIEGEEESGSAGFGYLLEKHKDLLSCDAVIVADLGNFSKGEPSLTTSLRGMSAIEIEIFSTKAPLHSGSWSGPLPDPAQELCRLIASLSDNNGNILVPNFYDDIIAPTPEELNSYQKLGMTEQKFREEAGVLESTKLLVPESKICETLWRKPSLVVTAMEAGNRKQAGNVLQESAYARLGIRLAPGMNAKKATEQIIAFLQANIRHGLTLKIRTEDGAEPFTTDTSHPYFQYMAKSMKIAFNQKASFVGCGASIPGAEYFRKTFGNIPILLMGVEDPESNAHGENESLYLPDFEKTILAETLFFKELANV